jgi:hypothetical protein
MRLCDAGIVPIMLIHDGILFEETDCEKLDHAIEIMRGAGRDVCGGLEIGVDIDQRLEGGTMKNRVLRDLEDAGVIAVRWSATRSPIVTLQLPL